MYVVDAELVVADSQRTDTGHVHKIQTGVDDGGWKQRGGGAGLGDGTGLGRQEAWKAVDGTGDDVWVRCEWWFAFSGVPVFQPVLCRCWLGWCWCLHRGVVALSRSCCCSAGDRRDGAKRGAGRRRQKSQEHRTPRPLELELDKEIQSQPHSLSPTDDVSKTPPYLSMLAPGSALI